MEHVRSRYDPRRILTPCLGPCQKRKYGIDISHRFDPFLFKILEHLDETLGQHIPGLPDPEPEMLPEPEP